MSEFCYVIVNNAGHSWTMLAPAELAAPTDQKTAILPQLLQEGWIPVRESPMGGGVSPVAHSLVLLEKSAPTKATRGRTPAK